jgi:predicted histidine transporter YuiF (NhaC family)
MLQNAFPVHMAVILILIPPLFCVFAALKMERRLLSNAMTFTMVATSAIVPYGFGSIFLENVIPKNLVESEMMHISWRDVLWAGIFPALGMRAGYITSCSAY